VPGVLDGRTLPAVFLRRGFGSWEDYLASLRSDYRRRMKRLGQLPPPSSKMARRP